MALPKTFTGGERLFASDLNDNFEALDTRTSALENASLAVDIAPSDTVSLDFSADRLVSRTAGGNITVSGTGYAQGKSVTLRIIAGASERTLSFPSSWKFVSFKPTAIAANKTGILAVTSFGVTEGDCVAAWAVEA